MASRPDVGNDAPSIAAARRRGICNYSRLNHTTTCHGPACLSPRCRPWYPILSARPWAAQFPSLFPTTTWTDTLPSLS